MPVIASIIFLALIVAAVGGGGLILARRLRLLLDIAAASFLLDADGSVAALTVSAISLRGKGRSRCSPSILVPGPIDPGSLLLEAAPHLFNEPAILTPAVLGPLPAVPESHSACRRAPLLRVNSADAAAVAALPPAQTVRVCLLCPTSSASARLSWGPSRPSPLH